MSIKEKASDLYQMIFSGKLLEAFDKYYAEDVVMQENAEEPTQGKSANREREIAFLESIEAFHDGGVTNLAWNDETGIVMIENWMDVSFKNGFRAKMEQVSVQTWTNDQIVHERFYYNKG
ncbi:hypothetical protein COW36_03980 [bacterium (Candidatus Blackallbacteria) CG17_big_fil_post_rev_8_21_14_2_50_48_46]|uniref:SnoaL-like domain-containing protein n=1 Tax=bacterium (Candidatus Blackallbacteria) CG17_big_fil_post_rev_8_21_14_2_50_48_46 TaxID=2014261 RepID=A0A2M7G9D8_9BACT|nr:MAG: polyketide cyclase [bacterium (Candidatus Blackallbacteria) CG18_big_fil_WC_8_21_14_2_50_49_26]PIW18723.1 MAG: hypothetical protein COW36_03980 [bacterium (Candidatus Blackallbacteria) CG17_big_fil_post_rev_8_21_14_2_50_48_46]PIW46605.1 MAG: hypothetical protein COW20_16700 [bacterium (Candidatus Blackallbacteria) CG13_big_fil_rev_8_21_14_2_50_49_14]